MLPWFRTRPSLVAILVLQRRRALQRKRPLLLLVIVE